MIPFARPSTAASGAALAGASGAFRDIQLGKVQDATVERIIARTIASSRDASEGTALASRPAAIRREPPHRRLAVHFLPGEIPLPQPKPAEPAARLAAAGGRGDVAAPVPSPQAPAERNLGNAFAAQRTQPPAEILTTALEVSRAGAAAVSAMLATIPAAAGTASAAASAPGALSADAVPPPPQTASAEPGFTQPSVETRAETGGGAPDSTAAAASAPPTAARDASAASGGGAATSSGNPPIDDTVDAITAEIWRMPGGSTAQRADAGAPPAGAAAQGGAAPAASGTPPQPSAGKTGASETGPGKAGPSKAGQADAALQLPAKPGASGASFLPAWLRDLSATTGLVLLSALGLLFSLTLGAINSRRSLD